MTRTQLIIYPNTPSHQGALDPTSSRNRRHSSTPSPHRDYGSYYEDFEADGADGSGLGGQDGRGRPYDDDQHLVSFGGPPPPPTTTNSNPRHTGIAAAAAAAAANTITTTTHNPARADGVRSGGPAAATATVQQCCARLCA